MQEYLKIVYGKYIFYSHYSMHCKLLTIKYARVAHILLDEKNRGSIVAYLRDRKDHANLDSTIILEDELWALVKVNFSYIICIYNNAKDKWYNLLEGKEQWILGISVLRIKTETAAGLKNAHMDYFEKKYK